MIPHAAFHWDSVFGLCNAADEPFQLCKGTGAHVATEETLELARMAPNRPGIGWPNAASVSQDPAVR